MTDPARRLAKISVILSQTRQGLSGRERKGLYLFLFKYVNKFVLDIYY